MARCYVKANHPPQAPFKVPGVKSWLWVALVFFLYLPFGCSTVSDEEMRRLREDTYALEAELATVKREAALLDRVLTNVYKERDQLVDQISRGAAEASGLTLPSPSNPDQQSPLPPAAGAADPDRPKVYRAQVGDTLSKVASRYGTTVKEILDLNAQIKDRSSQMLWVGDEVVLPPKSR
ncbi:MAG: LysM domain-containing protein [Deltaproteobacteria bacterium]|jgi:LysM repeat protein|nr:LysM domain-containing protein [Deltaproteobacteria bacterium]